MHLKTTDNMGYGERKLLLTLSAHSIQGKRDHMEDNFDIAYQLKPIETRNETNWPFEYFYLGIFDGHGGRDASLFAKRHLVKFITRHEHFWTDNENEVKRAIRDGFHECQEAMRKELPSWYNHNSSLPSTAGTTASVLFIKDGKFYSAHVGDSRIVILREHEETKMWIPDQLTQDHKPDLPSEVKRIGLAGGEVRDKFGVKRVVWDRPVYPKVDNYDMKEYHNYVRELPKDYPICETMVQYFQRIPFLAIARSLGDFWSLHPVTGLYVVSPEPDITCRPVTPQDKAIVLASDGLWNVFGSCQTSRMVQELHITKESEDKHPLSKQSQYNSIDNYYDVAGPKSGNYAKSMVYFAFQTWERRRLRSDNITVVVAMLHDLLANMSKQHESSQFGTDNVHDPLSKHCYSFNDCRINQIDDTFSYYERIYSGEYPTFKIPLTKARERTHSQHESLASKTENSKVNDQSNTPDKSINNHDDQQEELDHEQLTKLENLLLLPPEIIKQELATTYNKLSIPRNYLKLNSTSYRRIKSRYYFDAYILIKHVTDDPDDDIQQPSKWNDKHTKQVRDSSAQATQPIHDFGQPWCEMSGRSIREHYDQRRLSDFDFDDDDDDDEDDDLDSDYSEKSGFRGLNIDGPDGEFDDSAVSLETRKWFEDYLGYSWDTLKKRDRGFLEHYCFGDIEWIREMSEGISKKWNEINPEDSTNDQDENQNDIKSQNRKEGHLDGYDVTDGSDFIPDDDDDDDDDDDNDYDELECGLNIRETTEPQKSPLKSNNVEKMLRNSGTRNRSFKSSCKKHCQTSNHLGCIMHPPKPKLAKVIPENSSKIQQHVKKRGLSSNKPSSPNITTIIRLSTSSQVHGTNGNDNQCLVTKGPPGQMMPTKLVPSDHTVTHERSLQCDLPIC